MADDIGSRWGGVEVFRLRGVSSQNLGEEGLRPRMFGVAQDLSRVATFHDDAFVHEHQRVTHFANLGPRN
jgi:hypothetical protein